jgi:hypothetical protein
VEFVGGVFGFSENGDTRCCWSAGKASASRNVGQIGGWLQNGKVMFCCSAAEYGTQMSIDKTGENNNTINGLYTETLANMSTAAFANALNTRINIAVYTAWVQDATVFNGYPYPGAALGGVGQTHQIDFSANGGSGRMNTCAVKRFTAYTLPECEFSAPEGKQFKAWMIGNTELQPGDSVYPLADTVVFAVWEKAAVLSERVLVLKSYIAQYGESLGSSGVNKRITLQVTTEDGSSSVFVGHNSSTDEFSFTCLTESGTMQTTVSFVYDTAAYQAKNNTIRFRASQDTRWLECSAAFAIDAYSEGVTLSFVKDSESAASMGYTAAQVNELANAAVKTAVAYWNRLCTEQANVSLQQLGFESYGRKQASWIISLSRDKGTTTAQVFCGESGATVLCAAYDADGKMLSISMQSAQIGRQSYTFAHDAAADYVRVFLLKNFVPLCACKSV